MPRRIRLLFVSAVGEKGGLEVNLLNEVKHLDRQRFEPSVVCLAPGPFVDELRGTGVDVVVMERRRLRHVVRSAAVIARLTALMIRERIDVVVSENAVAHLYARPSAWLARGRLCLLRMGGVAARVDPITRLAFRLGAERLIANSRFTGSMLINAGVSNDLIHIVHRGVDLTQFEGGCRDASRASLGLAGDSKLVTVAGRLQRSKGQHVFLQAAADIAADHPRAHFLVVGDALFGIDREYPQGLQRLAVELGLNGRLRFVGFRTDVPALLAASDIVVVPSVEPEGFGMAALEAMAAGKPVVATNIGAIPELIRHEWNGLLVPPDSPAALGAAIRRLLNDGDLCARLGALARATAGEHFLIEAAVRAYERIYLACAIPT